MQEFETKGKMLSREAVGIIAALAMLLHHIADIFMPEMDALLSTVFSNLGCFAVLLLCYLTAEAYWESESKGRFAARLALFAIIAGVPYYLAFAPAGMIYIEQNFLFSLLICVGILIAREKIPGQGSRLIAIAVLIAISYLTDWPLLGPVFVLVLSWMRDSRKKQIAAFVVAALLAGGQSYSQDKWLNLPFATMLQNIAGAVIAVLLAAVLLLVFYRGRQAGKNGRFSKWFILIFYPAHLLILWLLRILMT